MESSIYYSLLEDNIFNRNPYEKSIQLSNKKQKNSKIMKKEMVFDRKKVCAMIKPSTIHDQRVLAFDFRKGKWHFSHCLTEMGFRA